MKLTTDFRERDPARSHCAVDSDFDLGRELLQGWDMMTKEAVDTESSSRRAGDELQIYSSGHSPRI
ncbi:hypothetical protein ACVWYH_001804 [Bradyrhizobium sp. GM24.11]